MVAAPQTRELRKVTAMMRPAVRLSVSQWGRALSWWCQRMGMLQSSTMMAPT